MTSISGTINALIHNGPESIGTIVRSVLTEAQFQTIRGAGWVRMEGQDITGSDLAVLTGNTILPDYINSEASGYQVGNEGDLEAFQSSQNKAHNHSILTGFTVTSTNNPRGVVSVKPNQTYSGGDFYDNGPSGSTVSGIYSNATAPMISYGTTFKYISDSGGATARPNRYGENHFIKINN